MKALVTGAAGFVGSAIVRALLREGWTVAVLVRPTSDRRNLEGLGVEWYTGDLLDPASLVRALEGCDALFHAAADYRLGVADPEELYRTNVEGTEHVLDAARRAGVARIVYTSSVATIGLPEDGTPGSESTPVSIDSMVGHYKRSKFLAEQAVIRAAHAGLPVVIVNPAAPVGPRDRKPTPTGQMVLDAARGRMPAYIDTGLNIVHVDDVADGHVLAHRHGRIGERYILGGENLSLKDILDRIASLTGGKPPRVRLPVSAVLPVAYAADWVARLTGVPNGITVEGVRMARKRMYFSSARAAAELGYRWRAPERSFADAVDWYTSAGLLAPRRAAPGP